MTETEVYDFVPQVPMVPCKAVGQAPAAVVVPMVPGKAVGQAPAVAVPMVPGKAVGQPPAVAVPMVSDKAVGRRMADNSVDSCMPSVFLLLIGF